MGRAVIILPTTASPHKNFPNEITIFPTCVSEFRPRLGVRRRDKNACDAPTAALNREEPGMADDKSKRGAQDRAKVSAMEDYEVKYLAQKHGVTQKAVKSAVASVGNSRTKVEAALKKSKG
jgi:hypothetical protein